MDEKGKMNTGEYEELAMEENVALANYRRKKLAQTGERGRNGNLQYLTIDEAAFMAALLTSLAKTMK